MRDKTTKTTWTAMLLPVWASEVKAREFPVRPYVDPSQLDVPWPKHSHLKVPWRAYLETRSGAEFLQGIGMNYNVSDNHDLAVRLLAEAGVKTFRIEIGWGSVNWDETGFVNEGRLRTILGLCRRYRIRPTILLNAHHGVPCPSRFFKRRLIADSPKGSRSVRLDNLEGIVPRYSGLSNLTGYHACEAFITAVNPQTKECRLSKPLPKGLKAGEKVLIGTLKYLPFHPVGTPEFEATARGWLRYVRLVLDLLSSVGIEKFDVEIWNELTFGSDFIFGINRYYDPPPFPRQRDMLLPGGHAWEVARRTIKLVKARSPKARCIWGFSNTTFFHTPIEKLPPFTDGQSYHPYGTGTRKYPEQEQAPDQPWRCLEGEAPRMVMRLPEGWACTFFQTESLIRLLEPGARRRRPRGTKRFFHYITEHGVFPPECGVTDEEGAWLLKAKAVLRAFCFWLNKGIDVLHYFCAHSRKPTDMGLLPPDIGRLPPSAKFDRVAPLPLRALRNLTKTFADSRPLPSISQLGVDVVALGKQTPLFKVAGKTLWHRDVFAFLPFQCHERKFVVAVYTMTYDVTKPMTEEHYRLTVTNLGGRPKAVRCYDPLTDRTVPVTVRQRGKGRLVVEVTVTDYPRLLEILL